MSIQAPELVIIGCAAAQDAQHYLAALDESTTIASEHEEVFA